MSKLFNLQQECVSEVHREYRSFEEKKKEVSKGVFVGDELQEGHVRSLIETVFWSSIHQNEGRVIRPSITYCSRARATHSVAFHNSLPFQESHLVKLSPAIPNSGSLMVSEIDTKLQIWGFTYGHPHGPGVLIRAVSVEALDPGVVQIGVGKYNRFAVLSESGYYIYRSEGKELTNKLLDLFRPDKNSLDSQSQEREWYKCNGFSELARLVLDDGHGGTILIVPDDDISWQKSLDPFPYRFSILDSVVSNALKMEYEVEQLELEMQPEIEKANLPDGVKACVKFLAGYRYVDGIPRDTHILAPMAAFAQVDGAVIMTRNLSVIGFGAKITSKPSHEVTVWLDKPENGGQIIKHCSMEDLGGTRHQSAARFVFCHRNCVALVISQDRHLSVVHWDYEIEGLRVIKNVEWWLT